MARPIGRLNCQLCKFAKQIPQQSSPVTTNQLRTFAQQLLDNEIDINQFVSQLAGLSSPETEQHASAVVDLDRTRRCGFSEVIFAQGKSAESVIKIAKQILENGDNVLVTRLDEDKSLKVRASFSQAHYHPLAKTLRIIQNKSVPIGKVTVISAGTSDMPVALEAKETVEWMGVSCELIQDVGVAGPQRLVSRLDRILGSDAIVVVAGMEGALPSVVGGHVDCPVIAVPTSVGYGANLGGFTALLAMLNSCAANIAVVNIDAGFKGGYLAGMIAHRAHKPQGGS